jgi:hypothetical protein
MLSNENNQLEERVDTAPDVVKLSGGPHSLAAEDLLTC